MKVVVAARMRVLPLLFLVGCNVEDTGLIDLSASIDLSMTFPNYPMCASFDCANSPCTPGCVFIPAVNGLCPSTAPVLISADKIKTCSGWCGLGWWSEGCLRYRPTCSDWCIAWSDPNCWEKSPDIDYATQAAICPSGFACFSGVSDAGQAPCVDLANHDGD
jgi:hypothetical protein